jgi:O-antigen/teichoic acid export membrane protein
MKEETEHSDAAAGVQPTGAASTEETPQSAKETLGSSTLRGMFWSYGSYVGGRLLSLIATAILARLISPSSFGLVALALTFMAFLDLIQGLGVAEAIVIADEDESDEQTETAFALNVGLGLLLAIVTAALGPAAASFFHQPQLVQIMPVLGLNFLLSGVGNTHAALALKRIDFRSRTAAELAEVLIRGVIGVALALAGAGVWSLVIGYVVGTAAWTVTLWICIPWRPHFKPRRRHVGRLVRFGGSLTGVAVLGAFLSQFDNLVVGRVLGAAALGFYTMATRLPYLLIVNLAVVAGRVLFPAFATLGDRDEMGRAYLSAIEYTVMVTLPLTVFMIILAEPLMVGLFGPKWLPAVASAQVLCLWALMSPLDQVSGNAFKSRGRPDIQLKIAIPRAILLVIGSLVFVHDGIVAVSWVQAGIALVTQFVPMLIAQRMFGLSFGALVRVLRPSLFASAALAAVLLLIHGGISGPWPQIIVGGVAGAVVYLGLIVVLAPAVLRRLLTMRRGLVKGAPA